jgi:hypothetical protein
MLPFGEKTLGKQAMNACYYPRNETTINTPLETGPVCRDFRRARLIFAPSSIRPAIEDLPRRISAQASEMIRFELFDQYWPSGQ